MPTSPARTTTTIVDPRYQQLLQIRRDNHPQPSNSQGVTIITL
jgi:hypothetical protein